MRQLLNSLYVTIQGAWLHREGDAVVVEVEREKRLSVPVHTLSSIVCFGQVSCSPFLMALCADAGVSMAFLTENGRFLARVQGPISGNVLLRRKQYQWADRPECAASIAFSVVRAKVANCRQNLLRSARDSSDSKARDALERTALRLLRLLNDIKPSAPVETVRGYEGEAARTYFEAFDHMILVAKENFFFNGRSRRPPLDNVNALLSFLYTLLTHDVASALESVGLDPGVGYLHTDRPGRPSLALDLVEELRPVLADRLALTLINRRQVTSAGFSRTPSGGITMNDETRREVLIAYQKRKQEELLHPFLKERISYGMIPFVQATLLARYMRGDLDGYASFLWR